MKRKRLLPPAFFWFYAAVVACVFVPRKEKEMEETFVREYRKYLKLVRRWI